MKSLSPHVDDLVGLDLPAGISHMPIRQSMVAAEGGSKSAGGYNGGRRDRRPLRNFRPNAGSADADTLLDLTDLRARSRELERNAPIATGAIATATTNVIGDGLALQASIDHELLGITPEAADQAERAQEREWAYFCKRADFTGVQSLDEMSELAYRSSKQSGDVIAVRRYRKDRGDVYGTKVQLIEADRLCNPNYAADTDTLAGGVESDAHGVPIAYHIAKKHPGALRLGGNSWERIPARDGQGRKLVIHLFERSRPELTRGVPYLGPVIEHLKQISTYSEAEVTAAVTSGFITTVVETPMFDENGEPVAGERSSNLEDNEIKLGAGASLELAPGEKINLLNPSRPNANFGPFMEAFLRQVGVALELPYELLIKHFTASYSASRAALEMAWQFFRKQRSRFAWRFNDEIYGWVMDEAVAMGRLHRPGYFADPLIREAWLGAEWIGPSRASLNPKMEAEADEVDIRAGVKTREQVTIERTGGEIEKKLRQLGKERRLMDDEGLVPEKPAAATPRPPADDTDEDDSDGDTESEGAAA